MAITTNRLQKKRPLTLKLVIQFRSTCTLRGALEPTHRLNGSRDLPSVCTQTHSEHSPDEMLPNARRPIGKRDCLPSATGSNQRLHQTSPEDRRHRSSRPFETSGLQHPGLPAVGIRDLTC